MKCDSSQQIKSVGIDIGTTTTQLIFSSLRFINRAPVSRVPHYEIVDRNIIYQSEIFFTPISRDGSIDANNLFQKIENEYAKAGFNIQEIDTGAIIITGETAKTQNAQETLMNLADKLGNFVLATAGPHFESIIAGCGSGSAEYSEKNLVKTMNIDIGGGTSNYVVFESGRVTDTACLNVGGRIIETDTQGRVTFLHEPAKKILEEIIPDFQEGLTQLHIADLEMFSERVADLIVECMTGHPSSLAKKLLMTNSLKPNHTIDAIFLTGGVGSCYYDNQDNLFRYCDIGPVIAESLKKQMTLRKMNILKPKQTIRATVIGAGAYSLSLSGSTVWVDDSILPLRNIPIIFPSLNWQTPEPDLVKAIELTAKRMDLELDKDYYAVFLSNEMPVSYKSVNYCKNEIKQLCNTYKNDNIPAIIISHNDIGKVLGMLLHTEIEPKPLLIVDEVTVKDGDYIDIGKSYFGGGVVPLTIKSLVFPS